MSYRVYLSFGQGSEHVQDFESRTHAKRIARMAYRAEIEHNGETIARVYDGIYKPERVRETYQAMAADGSWRWYYRSNGKPAL